MLWACGGSEPPGADDSAVEAGDCSTAVTWDNFGRGFVTQHCQPCHGSGSVSRNGAPEPVQFDTEDQVWTMADRVLVRATGTTPSMPPEGGVSDDDRELLRMWLTCDTPP